MPPKKPKTKKGFSAAHKKLLTNLRASAKALDIDTLGHANAVTIACACAGTSPLNTASTLQQLGAFGPSFQGCVFQSVDRLGFEINQDTIPDAPDTILGAVIVVIEKASRKG